MTKLRIKQITEAKFLVSYAYKGRTYTKRVKSYSEGLQWRQALWTRLDLIDVTGYSLERLIRECTIYSAGELYWAINDTSGTKKKMKKLGAGKTGAGYGQIKINGEVMYTHRAIWLAVHGALPTHGIDHIDGNRLNNDVSNLRDVPLSENLKNKRKQKNNTSGVTGVGILNLKNGTVVYSAAISHNGKRYFLGKFSTLRKAILARKKAQVDFGFHSNHGI